MSEQRYNGTIVSGRKDGKLANSDNIFDKERGKMQSDINKETKTRTDNSFDSLKQTKQSAEDGGENVITLTRHDGTSEQVKFYNGSKGSKGDKGEKGDKGDKGEVGMQGNSGVADASNKTLVNDAITGGETDFLSAEVGKLGILTYDCSKGGAVTHTTLQDAINSVPTTFQKVGLTITYKSRDTIYRYTLKANAWSADPTNWFSVEDKLSNLSENTELRDEKNNVVKTLFSIIDNPEFLAVEKDKDGKVLSGTYPDGSHYIHNVKSETIPKEFYHFEDPEGRIEITTDAENKILGYRDSEGTRHEHKISVNHIELSYEAAEEAHNAMSVYDNSSNLKNRTITQLFKTAPSVTLDKELMVHCACIATSINYGHFIAYYGDNENRSEAQNATCDFVLRNVSVLNPNNNVEIARFKTNSNVCGYSTGNKPIYDPNILMINDIVYLFVAAYSADRNEYEIIMLTYNPSTKEWADYSPCNLIYNGNSYNFSAASIKTIYQDKFNLTPEVTIISPTSKIVKDGEYYYTAIGVGGKSYTGFIVRTKDKTNWEIVDFIPVSYGFGNVGEVCMNIKDGIAYLIMRDDISSHKISRTTFDLTTKEWGELYDVTPSQRSKGWVEVYNGNIYYFYNSGDFNSGSYNIHRAIFECKKLNTSTNELEDVFTVTSDDATSYPYIENFLGTLYLVYTQERRKYLRNICLIPINNFLNI